MSKLFAPIDSESKEKLGERLAELLCEHGVSATGAFPLATQILAGVQAAVDAGAVTAAIAEWDERQREVEAWEKAQVATEQFRTRWRRWLGNKTRANKEDWVTLLDSNWTAWVYQVLDGAYLPFSTPRDKVRATWLEAINRATMNQLDELDSLYAEEQFEKHYH